MAKERKTTHLHLHYQALIHPGSSHNQSNETRNYSQFIQLSINTVRSPHTECWEVKASWHKAQIGLRIKNTTVNGVLINLTQGLHRPRAQTYTQMDPDLCNEPLQYSLSISIEWRPQDCNTLVGPLAPAVLIRVNKSLQRVAGTPHWADTAGRQRAGRS